MDALGIIKKNEGYRKKIYLDTKGIPTGGYGHAFLEGSELPDEVWDDILEHDIKSVEHDYKVLETEIGEGLDPVRKAVMFDLIYNIGLSNLLKFKLMLRAIKDKKWDEAARQLLDSNYKIDVRYFRAYRNAAMLESGQEWPT